MITHFTRPYSQLHVGKGKGQLKEGGTVSAPLAESCRLLREIDLPFACYFEHQNARLLAAGGGEQSSEALYQVRLYPPYISPISRLYLACISPISRLHLQVSSPYCREQHVR